MYTSLTLENIVLVSPPAKTNHLWFRNEENMNL